MTRISVTHAQISSFYWGLLELDQVESDKIATRILTPALINTRVDCEICLGLYQLFLRSRVSDKRGLGEVQDSGRARTNRLRARYQELVERHNPRPN